MLDRKERREGVLAWLGATVAVETDF